MTNTENGKVWYSADSGEIWSTEDMEILLTEEDEVIRHRRIDEITVIEFNWISGRTLTTFRLVDPIKLR